MAFLISIFLVIWCLDDYQKFGNYLEVSRIEKEIFLYKSMLNFKGTSLSNLAFATSGFSQNILAIIACNNRLGMAENNISLAATSTLDIHEIRIRGGD